MVARKKGRDAWWHTCCGKKEAPSDALTYKIAKVQNDTVIYTWPRLRQKCFFRHRLKNVHRKR